MTRWSVERSGPFFTKDPRKTFRKNIRDFMDEVAELGEQEVVSGLRGGEGSRQPIRAISPDRVSGHVQGRTSSLTGKRWAVHAVVSVNTAGRSRDESVAIRAAAARVEAKTGVFRKVTNRIRRARTDLLKGLH